MSATASPNPSNNKNRRTKKRSAPLALLPLEDRLVPSTITWTNRGNAASDSDGFAAAYGARADTARAIVDQAIASWEQVIVAFNHADPADDNYQLTITAGDIDDDEHTLGETSDIDSDGNDIPYSADIQLDDNAAGGSWFFDPTPGDNSEFTLHAGLSAANSPSATGADMYTVILHEIGHAVGLAGDGNLALGNQLQDTGFEDPNNPGDDLKLFVGGPEGLATFTTNGGGHFFPGPAPDPGIPTHPNDLLNPSVVGNSRRLISPLDAGVLRDAYGYTIKPPQQVAEQNFFTDLNSVTGVLRVNEDPRQSDDDIKISRDGADLVITDTQGLRVTYPAAAVQSIVIDPTLDGEPGLIIDGNEKVTIDYTGGDPIPAGGLSYDGGANGYDDLTIIGPAQGTAFDVSPQGITINNKDKISFTSVESLRIDAGGGNDTLRLRGNSGNVVLHGGDGADIIDVDAVAPATSAQIFGEAGDDTVTIARQFGNVDLIQGNLNLDGGAGIDHLCVNDSTNGYHANFDIDGDSVTTAGETFNYGDFATLEVDVGTAGNQVRVNQTGAITTIIGGDGSDSFIVGDATSHKTNAINHAVRFVGGAGADTLRIDSAGTIGDTLSTITSNTIGAAPGDTLFGFGGSVAYLQLNQVTLDLGLLGDTVSVNSTDPAAPVTINTGPGDNTVYLGGHAGSTQNIPPNTVDGIRSVVTVNGLKPVGDVFSRTRVIVNDTADTTGDNATVNFASLGANVGDTLFGPGGRLAFKNLVALRLDLGGGDDSVNVRAVAQGMALAVNGNAGNDTISVDSNGPAPGGGTSLVRGPLAVNGGAGVNRLVVEDSGDQTGRQVTVAAVTQPNPQGSIGAGAGDTLFPAGVAITHTGMQAVTLNTGDGNDTVLLTGTLPGTTMTIATGNGNDAVAIDSNGLAPGGLTATIRGPVSIDGGQGTNQLTVDDSSDMVGEVAHLGAGQIAGAPGDTLFGPGGVVTHSHVGVTLNGGTVTDTIYVQGTAAGLTTTLNLGAGNDAIVVDSNAQLAGGTADQILGPLVIDGGLGANSLTLEDSGDTTGDTLTLAPNLAGASGDSFFGPGGSVAFAKIGTLAINGGSGGNAINVTGTDPATSVNINGGKGADVIRVDSNGAGPGGTVDLVRSALKITGGGGKDQLILDDTGDTTADRLTVTAALIGKAATDNFFGPGGSITYSGLAGLQINMGTGDDKLTVRSQAKATDTRIDLGAGNDSATVQVDHTSAYQGFVIAGNTGTDILGITDLGLNGLIKTHKANNNGWIDVTYPNAPASRVDFTSMETTP